MEHNKLSDKELYLYCQNLGKQVLLFHRKFVGLIPEVYRRNLYKKYNFASIHEFSAKLAGISKHTVDKVIILDRKLSDYPKLRNLLTTGKIGWAKLSVIATTVNSDTEDFFVEKVQVMSKSALEVLCKDYRKELKGKLYISDEHISLTLKLSPKNLQKLRLLQMKCKTSTWNDTFNKLFEMLENSSIQKVVKAKSLESKSRYIPIAKRQEINSKYNDICAHPNCNNPSQVLHHKDPYSISKNHNSLIPLCNTHHEIAHNTFYKNEDSFNANFNPNKFSERYLIDKKYQLHKAPG